MRLKLSTKSTNTTTIILLAIVAACFQLFVAAPLVIWVFYKFLYAINIIHESIYYVQCFWGGLFLLVTKEFFKEGKDE